MEFTTAESLVLMAAMIMMAGPEKAAKEIGKDIDELNEELRRLYESVEMIGTPIPTGEIFKKLAKTILED